MEFDLKVDNEMEFFFKLDKDLATKLLSSQKAPWPTFSAWFQSHAKRPRHLAWWNRFPQRLHMSSLLSDTSHNTGSDTNHVKLGPE